MFHNGIVGVVGSNPIGSTIFSAREPAFRRQDLPRLGFPVPGRTGRVAQRMTGLASIPPQTTRLVAVAGVVLALLGGTACDAGKQKSPPPHRTNAPPAILPPPPPSPTNAPARPPAPRTPEEQFQAGLRLWNGKGAARDPAEAVKLFTLAAERGNVDAQAHLAAAHRTGVGVAKSPEEAVRWFRAAAERGDARSQGVLASIYGTGEGVPKDLPEAVKLYRLAAAQGLVRAQANLGAMLFLGQGVAKDPVEAYKWLHLAALKGDQEAMKNRGLVAQKMSAAQMAEGRRRAAEFVPARAR